MSTYNKKALHQVQRVLRNVIAQGKPFDLSSWYVHVDNDCGTASCAIGHCTEDSWFKNLGLKRLFDTGNEPAYEVENGYVYQNWGAVRKFFGLSGYDANLIFSKGAYKSTAVTPQQVIDRIDWYIAARDAGTLNEFIGQIIGANL